MSKSKTEQKEKVGVSKRCCCRFHDGERILPLKAFRINKNGRQGRYNWCIDCQRYYNFLKRHDLMGIEAQYSK